MPYLQTDDTEIYYTDHAGSGPVIVLMHGAAGNSDCWVEQLPVFQAAGFRVITYDLRGFGRTRSAPGQDASGSMAADLRDLAQGLGLPRFALVAQAYGGFGALEFAADEPEALDALVVSTSFGGLTDPEYATLRSRYVPADLNSRPVEERELGATYRAANPEGVRRFLVMEAGSYRGDGARQSLRRPMTLDRVGGIRVPSLIIAADEDLYAPPPVMRAFAERIPGARFEVIEKAGHCAYWEQPEVWNALILDFLHQTLQP
jgi:pimeloyl-ACP methyl ester carboxylesterase